MHSILCLQGSYATRFTSEILCDAKDFATHAGRNEIEVDDIKLAIRLHDSRTNAFDPKLKFVLDTQEIINAKPLPHIPEDRLLSLPENNLLQRTFTFVPGKEAYPEVLDNRLKNNAIKLMINIAIFWMNADETMLF